MIQAVGIALRDPGSFHITSWPLFSSNCCTIDTIVICNLQWQSDRKFWTPERLGTKTYAFSFSLNQKGAHSGFQSRPRSCNLQLPPGASCSTRIRSSLHYLRTKERLTTVVERRSWNVTLVQKAQAPSCIGDRPTLHYRRKTSQVLPDRNQIDRQQPFSDYTRSLATRAFRLVHLDEECTKWIDLMPGPWLCLTDDFA